MLELLALVVSLNEPLQQLQLDLYHPVSEDKLVGARKLLDLGQEPVDEVLGFGDYVFLSRHLV